jgi:DNA-binding GntR family transcriptional regulator
MLGAMDALDPDDTRPSYQQIADRLRAAIKTGNLRPGDQLPSHKALSDNYDVAVETVKRALGELRTDGLIVTRQGKGTYVRQRDALHEPGAQGASDGDLSAQLARLSGEIDLVKQRLAALERREPTR